MGLKSRANRQKPPDIRFFHEAFTSFRFYSLPVSLPFNARKVIICRRLVKNAKIFSKKFKKPIDKLLV